MDKGYEYSSMGMHFNSNRADHVVKTPKVFVALQILQIIFAIGVLGLSSYLISQTSGGVFSAEVFATFSAAATIILTTYRIVAERFVHGIYTLWAVASVDVLGCVFWMGATASLGALRDIFRRPVAVMTCTYGIDSGTGNCILDKRDPIALWKRGAWAGSTYLNLVASDAALSGVEVILFLISLAVFAMYIHRHRNSSSQKSKPFDVSNVVPKAGGYRSVEKVEMSNIMTNGESAPEPTHQPSSATLPVYSEAQAYHGPGSAEGPFSDMNESPYDPPVQQPLPTLNFQKPFNNEQSAGFQSRKTTPYDPHKFGTAPPYPGVENTAPYHY